MERNGTFCFQVGANHEQQKTKPCEALHEVKLIAKQLLAGGNEWQVVVV